LIFGHLLLAIVSRSLFTSLFLVFHVFLFRQFFVSKQISKAIIRFAQRVRSAFIVVE
jgi:hypothetical protein